MIFYIPMWLSIRLVFGRPMRLDGANGIAGFPVKVRASQSLTPFRLTRYQMSNCLNYRLALQMHEAKIFRHVDRLDQCIEADVDQNRPSDTKNLMYWFGFDAMGDFVFNRPLGMLEGKTWHHIMVRSYRAVELLGPFSPAPWLIHIGFHLLPRVSKLRDWSEMTEWCRQIMEQRLKDEALQKELDMTHYLMMQEDAENGEVSAAATEHNRFWLQGDSLLVIVAGRYAD